MQEIYRVKSDSKGKQPAIQRFLAFQCIRGCNNRPSARIENQDPLSLPKSGNYPLFRDYPYQGLHYLTGSMYIFAVCP